MLKLFKKTDPRTSFWKWFIQREGEIHSKFEEDKDRHMGEIGQRLNEIDPNITFEVGTMNEEGTREFIISADGIADSFESVESLYRLAPTLPNWTIIKFRPRMNSESIEINMGEVTLSYEDIYFLEEDHGHYVDLKVYIQHYDAQDERFQFAYFILLDSLIGEYDAVSKIGETTIRELTDSIQEQAKKFIELRAIIDHLSES